MTLASDAVIPFRANIDRTAASGVRYVIQPGGAYIRQGDESMDASSRSFRGGDQRIVVFGSPKTVRSPRPRVDQFE